MGSRATTQPAAEPKQTAQTGALQAAARTKTELEREPSFELFDRIYNAIAKRAFEIFAGDGHAIGHDVENWIKAEAELLHPVHMTIAESDGRLNATAEVPGFEAKDLEIKLEPSRLTISGKRETKHEHKSGKTVYHEHCSDQIFRAVDLPAEVDGSKAEAKLKNGILEIQMPKGKPAKTTRVQVKAG